MTFRTVTYIRRAAIHYSLKRFLNALILVSNLSLSESPQRIHLDKLPAELGRFQSLLSAE
jgi:hypothetical protein